MIALYCGFFYFMRCIKHKDWPVDGTGYIYAMVHPITKEPVYIGQTKKSLKVRLSYHVNSAKIKTSALSKTPVGKWIIELLSNNLKPEMILLDCVPIDKLNDAEIEAIRVGRTKLDLLNVEDGGKSGRKKGFKQPIEFCERQRRERSGLNNINFIDLTGKKFKKLTVLKLDGFRDFGSYWVCQCECGTIKIIRGQKLIRLKSCGCAKKERWTDEAKKKLSEYNKANRRIAPNGQLLKMTTI